MIKEAMIALFVVGAVLFSIFNIADAQNHYLSNPSEQGGKP